jgi:N-methylhydantoinase A
MAGAASLGIDIGGTFTDLVIHHHATGERHALKVLTTHDDPRRGVMQGVALLLGQSALPPAAITRVVHATTLFTNALIERKGAKTGLITTSGFRDTLEIGRERKYALYDLAIEMPAKSPNAAGRMAASSAPCSRPNSPPPSTN